MYKKSLIRLLAFLLFLSLHGCIYLDTTMPLDKDLDKTQLGTKKGEASIYCVLWLVAWGDSGSKAAADNGHITTINHADKHLFSIFFGAFTQETTIVYGD